MSVNAPKPEEMPAIDYADHTVEVDMRWLIARRNELNKLAESSESADGKTPDDSELDASQISELLNRK